MAQALRTGTPTGGDFAIGQRSEIRSMAVIHEPVASTIGNGSTAPYVGVFVLAGTSSSTELWTGAGRLEAEVVYRDGTRTSLINDSTPFGSRTLTTSGQYFVADGTGNWDPFTGTPTASTTLSSSSNSSTRQRLPLSTSSTKVPARVEYFWTD